MLFMIFYKKKTVTLVLCILKSSTVQSSCFTFKNGEQIVYLNLFVISISIFLQNFQKYIRKRFKRCFFSPFISTKQQWQKYSFFYLIFQKSYLPTVTDYIKYILFFADETINTIVNTLSDSEVITKFKNPNIHTKFLLIVYTFVSFGYTFVVIFSVCVLQQFSKRITKIVVFKSFLCCALSFKNL